MKGLIIKDFFCMKRSLHMIIVVSICVITLAVLFVLSSRYGNISKIIIPNSSNTLEIPSLNGNKLTEAEFISFSRYAIWVVLFIPMAFIANILDCFTADYKASFGKNLFSMPISNKEIVGARFLSCIIYAAIGMTASILAAICVSTASNQINFVDLISVILMFAALMIIFVSITIPFVYLIGSDKKDLIQILVTIITLIIIALLIKHRYSYIKNNTMNVNSEILQFAIINDINRNLTTKGLYFFLISIIVLFISYLISVKILKKRRSLAI